MLLKNYAKTGQRKDFESIFYRALRRAAKKSEKISRQQISAGSTAGGSASPTQF